MPENAIIALFTNANISHPVLFDSPFSQPYHNLTESVVNAYDKGCGHFLQRSTAASHAINMQDLVGALNKIVTSLNDIALHLTPEPWWISLDWLNPLMVFLATILAYWLTRISKNNDDKKVQEQRLIGEKSQETRCLNTAIAGLVDIRCILLIFKGEFVQKRYDISEQLQKTLNNAVDESDKERIKAINERGQFANDIRSKWEEPILRWYNAIGAQEGYKVFREDIPRNHLNHSNYAKELAFMAKSHPQYLLSFHRVQGFIAGVDEFIDKYNKVLQDQRERYMSENITSTSILVTHGLLFSSTRGLYKLVDDTLRFVRDSYEFIKKYSIKHGLKINTKLITAVTTDYDDLMPDNNPDDRFRKMIQHIDEAP